MPLAAPGVNIYSTLPNNKYAAMSGTSMATPFVASLVALIKSLDPDLKTEEIYGIINLTGKAIPDQSKTGKLIQPYNAIKAVLNKN